MMTIDKDPLGKWMRGGESIQSRVYDMAKPSFLWRFGILWLVFLGCVGSLGIVLRYTFFL